LLRPARVGGGRARRRRVGCSPGLVGGFGCSAGRSAGWRWWGWGVAHELCFWDEAELHRLSAWHDARGGASLVVLGEPPGCGGAREEGGEGGAQSGVVVGLVVWRHEVRWAPMGAGVWAALHRRAGMDRGRRAGGVSVAQMRRRVGKGVWLGSKHRRVGWSTEGCRVLVVVAIRVRVHHSSRPHGGLMAQEVRGWVYRFG
jgi:hypothetical protein